MAERLKASVLKAEDVATRSQVQILPVPPDLLVLTCKRGRYNPAVRCRPRQVASGTAHRPLLARVRERTSEMFSGLSKQCITVCKVTGGRQRPLPVPLPESWEEDERYIVRRLAHLL